MTIGLALGIAGADGCIAPPLPCKPPTSFGISISRASIGVVSSCGITFVRIRMSENPLNIIAQIAIASGMIHSRRRAGSSNSGGRIAI